MWCLHTLLFMGHSLKHMAVGLYSLFTLTLEVTSHAVLFSGSEIVTAQCYTALVPPVVFSLYSLMTFLPMPAMLELASPGPGKQDGLWKPEMSNPLHMLDAPSSFKYMSGFIPKVQGQSWPLGI